METKHPTSIRLSAEERRLVAAIASKLGVSQSAVLALAIRELARRHGVK